MCVALPGRIVSIDGDTAKVDFSGNTVNVNIGIIDAKVDQYVLVHAGVAIEVMDKEKAQDIIDLFAEIEEMEHGYQ
ncbi:MAG: HypC/HybG/HupF family hydrogenase formation chaperone [Firmicutes bacterium]|jgi:hydrogenase expression/formation protein HypC|nr:HypC/HybG/HupF family hydrogenase formation chaperone [Bacillota bacterium]